MAALIIYVAGGIFLSYRFGDALWAAGGEGLTVAAGLAYFAVFVVVMEGWA
ncbi:hypothetical protein [Mesorhizobium sp. M0488]|uniref:hypothetical protein n=1 Tax=unclassified Mesorhizobium TaxID=325217 RepID=UPI00333AA1AB